MLGLRDFAEVVVLRELSAHGCHEAVRAEEHLMLQLLPAGRFALTFGNESGVVRDGLGLLLAGGSEKDRLAPVFATAHKVQRTGKFEATGVWPCRQV